MGDLTLWIDGISIDQTPTAERSAQVALMRDIYKQVAEVVVWLGEEDEPSKGPLAFESSVEVFLFPWLYLAIALDMLRASDYKWGDWHSAMQLQAYLSRPLAEKREGNGAKCTDPKDRIFALFGIFQELDIIVPAPDYSETLGRIYAAATVACFTNDPCMEFLYHVPSENRRAGLPSWTVDWGDAAWTAADQRVTVTRKPFTASGMSSPSLQFSENTLRIQIQGSIVDRVRQVGQLLSVKSRQRSAINERLVWDGLRMGANNGWNLDDTAKDIHAAFEVFASWVDLASSARSQSSGEDAENGRYALCETLLEYHSFEGTEQEIVNLKPSFWPWLEAIQVYSSATMQQKPTPPRSSTALESFLTLTKGNGSRFQLKIISTCQGKRFVITEDEEIGLVPDIVQVEDFVALISGLHMPVILRPVNQGRFLYVCHAYIHGLMGGEKWDRGAKVGTWLT
ncbi:heterokaryon incompatibility domain-containing protein [Trichoderma compactum]